MTHLMQIEADFLASAEVRESLNFQSIFNLQSEVSDAKKSKFDKSLKLAKLVTESFIWFDTAETKILIEENGIEWSSKEMFINRVFGWQKSFGYKMNKVGKLAEEEGHHPDLWFGWGYARIKIFTHAIKGLAESDFILAAKIDQISNA